MVIVGFAYKKIEFQTEAGTKWAGYNVFTLFMVMQCACKYYGGHAGLAIYLFSAVASYILLPGVILSLNAKSSSIKRDEAKKKKKQ